MIWQHDLITHQPHPEPDLRQLERSEHRGCGAAENHDVGSHASSPWVGVRLARSTQDE